MFQQVKVWNLYTKVLQKANLNPGLPSSSPPRALIEHPLQHLFFLLFLSITQLIILQENQSAKSTAATLTFQVFTAMFQTHILFSFNFQNSQNQKVLIFTFPICAILVKSNALTLRQKIAYFTRKKLHISSDTVFQTISYQVDIKNNPMLTT